MKHILSAMLVAALVTSLPRTAGAQGTQGFRARLAPVPIDLTMAATIAGFGSVTATLTGSKLALTGTFQGLRSPATVARLHRAPRGIRGPALLDLQVTKSTEGSISAQLDLTPQQAQDLRVGRLYIQLHSEQAPDGNLWGWLLPQETKR